MWLDDVELKLLPFVPVMLETPERGGSGEEHFVFNL